jgi:hypothetical protein
LVIGEIREGKQQAIEGKTIYREKSCGRGLGYQ